MRDVGDGQGVTAAFSAGADVVASMLDPERPTIAAIDDAPIQALMCTRRDPVPDAEDAPLVASGIPFILSTDFDSADAPLVTLGLDGDRRAVVRIAVGLSPAQETALEKFITEYEPVGPKYTDEDDVEPVEDVMEDAEPEEDTLGDSDADDGESVEAKGTKDE